MKKLFTLLFALMISVGTMYAVTINGLNYTLNSSAKTAEVASDNSVSGSIVIPSTVTYNNITYSVTSIGNNAFRSCSGLTSVFIPNTVTYIGTSAFQNCSRLTSATIPNSVTRIERYAFAYCYGLMNVTIPNSVTTIGSIAFYDVPNIVYSGTTSGSPWGARSVNGYIEGYMVYSDNTKTNLLACSSEATGTISIPNTVTSIGNSAFVRCSSLMTVTIPNSVKSIGDNSFSYCSGLTSLTIPNSITSIGYNAFNWCSGLTSITIPNSVTSIGHDAFYYCSGLASVTIGNSVTNIGSSAFYGCSGLTSIKCDATTPPVCVGDYVFHYVPKSIPLNVPKESIDLYKAANSWKEFTNIVSLVNGTCGTNLTWSLNLIDSTLTISGTGSMSGWSKAKNVPWYNYRLYIKSVQLPSGVTNIGTCAFAGCSNLKNITLPNSVTTIGNSAFSGCSGITNIDIPNSVTRIDGAAFYNCSSLESVTIPYGISYLSDNIFSYCTSLKSIVWNAKTCTFYEDEDHDIVNPFPLSVRNQITSFIFGDGVEEIPAEICHGMKKLTSITIPSSVTSIGSSAFFECTGLASIEIPNSVTSIGKWAFYGCSGLTSVTISNSVTSIGFAAFDGCTGLTSVTIPNSVTSIGDYAFGHCSGLTSITNYAHTPQEIDNYDYVFYNVNKSICTLYVPKASVNLYKAATGWKDFANINPISWHVTFLDYDNSVLFEQEVEDGEAAVTPANPSREGYTFIGWDKDFSNVTENMTITAQYKINRYEYVFKDWDETELKKDSADWNTAAVGPETPTRDGYIFLGWDKDFSHITENIVITAQYIQGTDHFALTSKLDGSTIGLSTLASNQTLEYTTDGETWQSLTTTTSITLNSGYSLCARGKLTGNNTMDDYTQFAITGSVEAKGNINYLWDYEDLEAPLKERCGFRLFNGCTCLSDASQIVLPSTTLANACYQDFLFGCTNILYAPELPATVLAAECYRGMFYGCSNLLETPSLPATTLANGCYYDMFNGCTNLPSAPSLPATTLAERCYYCMFFGCKALTTAPVLPAKTLKTSCYYKMFKQCSNLRYIKCLATDISAEQCLTEWVKTIPSSGTFIKHQNMNSWPSGKNGIPSGWTVSSLMPNQVFFDANGGIIPVDGNLGITPNQQCSYLNQEQTEGWVFVYSGEGYFNEMINDCPTREGYSFLGWFTDVTEGEKVYDENGNCVTGSYWNNVANWIGASDLQLYAQWQNNSPTTIEETSNEQLPATKKVMKNGQIYILRGDKTYTITGAEVK